MTTKAKDGRETLQERLRDHQRANYLSASTASISLCNEAADALDAAARKELFDEGIIRVLTHERDGWRTRADAAQADIARLEKDNTRLRMKALAAEFDANIPASVRAPLPVAEDVVERLAYLACDNLLGDDCCRHEPEKSKCTVENCRAMKFATKAVSLLRQPEAAPEGWWPNWKWDHSVAGQPEKVRHYDRGELLLGKISLGQYSRWSDISLGRDGIDPKKPIHAWLSHASFVGGVYQYAPSAWFATAEEAKAFVEEGALKTLSDAGMLLVSTRELVSTSAPTPASAVARDEALESLQSAYDELCVQFSGVHSDDQMDSVLHRLFYALKVFRSKSATPAPASAQDELVKALKFFADFADEYDDAEDDSHNVMADYTVVRITLGDLRRAKAALSATGGAK